MKPSLTNIRNEVENYLDYLTSNKLVMFPNSRHEETVGSRSRLSWQRGQTTNTPLAKFVFGSWQEYKELVDCGRFSFMLHDGSFVFFSYEFLGSRLYSHSLLFYPCPTVVDSELLEDFAILELVESEMRAPDSVRLKTPVRIDFDPDNVKDHHPPVHAHLNSADCRMGVQAPMSPSMFISFIFRSFYFDTWNAHEMLQRESRLLVSKGSAISQTEKKYLHLGFA
ncbi:MAG: DUF2290 domain-containing protein [Planctomycetales bacterium]|nr:DUF2290 domain-containing protein [Planctomycetales bacterium]